MVIIRDKISSRGEDVERRDPSHTAGVHANLGTHHGSQRGVCGGKKTRTVTGSSDPTTGKVSAKTGRGVGVRTG